LKIYKRQLSIDRVRVSAGVRSVGIMARRVLFPKQNEILVKNAIFFIPQLHSTPSLAGPCRNIATAFGVEKN